MFPRCPFWDTAEEEQMDRHMDQETVTKVRLRVV